MITLTGYYPVWQQHHIPLLVCMAGPISLLKLTQTDTTKKVYELHPLTQDILIPINKMSDAIDMLDEQLQVCCASTSLEWHESYNISWHGTTFVLTRLCVSPILDLSIRVF